MDLLAPFVGNHLEKMLSATVLSVLQTGESKGVIVCDMHGRVLFCNEIARGLCSFEQQLRRQPASEDITTRARSLHRGRSTAEAGLAPDAGLAAFVGSVVDDPEELARRCHVGVSSRTISLNNDTPGLLITLEYQDGYGPDWNEPLKNRFALTDREIEVLRHAMAGRSNREIAQALFIAEVTVKKHMHSIACKVGARSRTAIAHAVRQAQGDGGR